VVSSFLPTGTREEITASPNPFDAKLVFLLLVTLVLTPLQAAGEEYLFRGYLTQAFGTIVPTAFAVLVPALLFGLAHGLGQGLPIFIDRFAFGLVAGVLVVLTGGIEAGLAMHLVNNWIAFGLAIVLGNLGDALQPVARHLVVTAGHAGAVAALPRPGRAPGAQAGPRHAHA
jgi:membrane protease YdiL (CAAX protease family)